MKTFSEGDRVVDLWGNRLTVTGVPDGGELKVAHPSGEEGFRRRWQVSECRCDGTMLLGNVPCECAELGGAA